MAIFGTKNPAKAERADVARRIEAAGRLQSARKLEELLVLVDDLAADADRVFGAGTHEAGLAHRIRIRALADAGRLDEAEAHFHAVLPGFPTGGNDGAPGAALRACMAGILSRQGRAAEAHQLGYLADAERRAGGRTSPTLPVEATAALTDALHGRFAQAEQRLNAVLGQLPDLPRDIRPATEAGCRNNLAFALIGLERWTDAEAQARRAHQVFLTLEGPGSDGALSSGANLAWALLGAGKPEAAATESRAHIGLLLARGAWGHPLLCILRTTLGSALAEQGAHAAAAAELREAVNVGVATQGPTGWPTLRAVAALAAALTASDDTTEARRLLDTAVRTAETDPNTVAHWLDPIRKQLADLPGA
ncbi:tetratricopeptide repeat protein [Yinghuangia soli]|uniref:Tetratricopeptide repeat protein n=1 Tax=Yinghuangia soli TaxID=2908204 RepID=A0AA41Q618_9ACTN|nr:tetratricopeptide repeat protein [Yinghuangia soli]MCF2531892.1 tetratricopeptide repeat protein [Yinghuangia soli]